LLNLRNRIQTAAPISKSSYNSGPVWQGSGSLKNGFGSSSFSGAASLVELEMFCKIFGKTAPLYFFKWIEEVK